MTDRNSSRTEKPLPPPLAEDSQDEEKMDGPNALDSPPVGNVREPDLNRLLRSVTADEATDEATDVA